MTIQAMKGVFFGSFWALLRNPGDDNPKSFEMDEIDP